MASNETLDSLLFKGKLFLESYWKKDQTTKFHSIFLCVKFLRYKLNPQSGSDTIQDYLNLFCLSNYGTVSNLVRQVHLGREIAQLSARGSNELAYISFYVLTHTGRKWV